MTDLRYRCAQARACYAWCRKCGGPPLEALGAFVATFCKPGAC